MQLLSNNCGATFTPYYCGTTSIAANHLTPGTTYFIRVYSTAAAAPITTVGWEFNICIQDPVTPPPYNDNCATAINLPIWNSCNNIPGSMAGATPSGIPLGGACAGPQAYELWYIYRSQYNRYLTLSGMEQILSTHEWTVVGIVVLPFLYLGVVRWRLQDGCRIVYYIRVFLNASSSKRRCPFQYLRYYHQCPVRFGNTM